jgi:hypothetical protein
MSCHRRRGEEKPQGGVEYATLGIKPNRPLLDVLSNALDFDD